MFLVSAVCILLGVLGNQGSKAAARSGGPASDSAGRTESAAPADDKTEDFIGSASR